MQAVQASPPEGSNSGGFVVGVVLGAPPVASGLFAPPPVPLGFPPAPPVAGGFGRVGGLVFPVAVGAVGCVDSVGGVGALSSSGSTCGAIVAPVAAELCSNGFVRATSGSL